MWHDGNSSGARQRKAAAAEPSTDWTDISPENTVQTGLSPLA